MVPVPMDPVQGSDPKEYGAITLGPNLHFVQNFKLTLVNGRVTNCLRKNVVNPSTSLTYHDQKYTDP